MPGLVPGIHVLRAAKTVVDGRDTPGHDVVETPVRNLSKHMRLVLPASGRGEPSLPPHQSDQ